MEKIFLPVKEAAKALGLSEWYVYQGLRSGKIPGGKNFGRRVLVHRETLEAWAREQIEKGEVA